MGAAERRGGDKPRPLAPQHDSGAPGQHVVGNAAAANAGAVGTGTDTTPSGDWLAERQVQPTGAAQPPPGVPVSTETQGDLHKGRSVESKRGQQGG